jgi:hypothetical protein
MNERRKKVQDMIDGVLKALDPSGINAQKYRNKFQTMNDAEFDKYIKEFLNDDKSQIRCDIEEFGDNSRKIMWENVEKAAKVIDVKLFEYIYMPHLSSNKDRPVRSRQPVLVGYINIKRPQQLVTKKTGLILDDTDTDVMTGEAKGDSKGGTMTGMENELLAGVGANTVLSEIIGARGDNVTEYQAMTAEIAEKGSVSLSDIKTGVFDKPTLLQADLFLSDMGIKTDLISESYYAINKIRNAMNNEK